MPVTTTGKIGNKIHELFTLFLNFMYTPSIIWFLLEFDIYYHSNHSQLEENLESLMQFLHLNTQLHILNWKEIHENCQISLKCHRIDDLLLLYYLFKQPQDEKFKMALSIQNSFKNSRL